MNRSAGILSLLVLLHSVPAMAIGQVCATDKMEDKVRSVLAALKFGGKPVRPIAADYIMYSAYQTNMLVNAEFESDARPGEIIKGTVFLEFEPLPCRDPRGCPDTPTPTADCRIIRQQNGWMKELVHVTPGTVGGRTKTDRSLNGEYFDFVYAYTATGPEFLSLGTSGSDVWLPYRPAMVPDFGIGAPYYRLDAFIQMADGRSRCYFAFWFNTNYYYATSRPKLSDPMCLGTRGEPVRTLALP